MTGQTDRLGGPTGDQAVKAPCKTLTTGNITLSGEQTVNGIACVAGDRVLVKNQTSSINNGIYNVSTSAWTRATDFDGNRDVRSGTLVVVNSADTSQTIWRVTTADPVTFGTSAITFVQSVFGALDATGVNFVNSGASASTRTVQSRMRDWVSVKDYGAVGDGATDDSAAFAAAITSVAGSGSSNGGGTIYVPRATYKLNSELAIKFQVRLVGDGGIDNYGTRLLFADGKGIHIYHSSDSGTGTDGSWSIIENMRVTSVAKTNACNGIYISGHGVRIENVSVAGFKTDGIHIVASGGTGNANNWVLSNVRSTSNSGHGFFIDGGDANAGFALSCDASSNSGWGFYDSSFLGNTYVACHTATNTLGPYKTDDPSARNVFLGCYSESDQTGSSIVTPSLVLGGLHGAGFLTGTNAAWLDDQLGVAVFNRGVASSMVDGSGNTVVARMGGDATNGDIINTSHTAYGPLIFRLHYHGADGNLQWDYNNSDGAATYQITGPVTTRTFGRAAIEPYAFQTDRLFVGGANGARQITTLGNAPATGQHAVGDICFNSNPSIGNPKGWQCTVAGTPGTWVSMGNL